MLICEFDLVGQAPISFSGPIQSPKKQGEPDNEYDERTWREKMHTKNGEVYIPPMALKNCLAEVAKYRAETVPGRGKATYTKHFEAGVNVLDPIMLGIRAEDVKPERLFVPSDGRRGGGKRVWRTFPTIPEWRGSATVYVFDPVVNAAKVEEYARWAGMFIGLGRFRPRNNGFYGRFSVVGFESRKEE